MQVTSFLFPIILHLSLVLTHTVTQNTVDYGTLDLSLNDVAINPDVYWSIINNEDTSIVGDLKIANGAGFYVSSTSTLIGLNIGITGDTVVNDGIISFNSIQSFIASDYVITAAKSFVNNGNIYMGTNGAAGFGVLSIESASVTNNGLMVFHQSHNSGGTVTIGGSKLVKGITNDGQICLYNDVLVHSLNIEGNGCISAQANSTIYMNNPQSTFNGQDIYLADKDSSLIVTPSASSRTINIYGFGNGNMISLSTTLNPLTTIPFTGAVRSTSYTYNPTTGVLILYSSIANQAFHIGQGYVSNAFSVTTNWNAVGAGVVLTHNAVTYSLAPPAAATKPANCALCSSLPTIPGISGKQYITTFYATTEGQICTEVDNVIITSDGSGNFYTTTSSINASCSSTSASYTRYSTSFATTESDGFVTRESVETTNHSGELYTTTSLFPTSSGIDLTPTNSFSESVSNVRTSYQATSTAVYPSVIQSSSLKKASASPSNLSTSKISKSSSLVSYRKPIKSLNSITIRESSKSKGYASEYSTSEAKYASLSAVTSSMAIASSTSVIGTSDLPSSIVLSSAKASDDSSLSFTSSKSSVVSVSKSSFVPSSVSSGAPSESSYLRFPKTSPQSSQSSFAPSVSSFQSLNSSIVFEATQSLITSTSLSFQSSNSSVLYPTSSIDSTTPSMPTSSVYGSSSTSSIMSSNPSDAAYGSTVIFSSNISLRSSSSFLEASSTSVINPESSVISQTSIYMEFNSSITSRASVGSFKPSGTSSNDFVGVTVSSTYSSSNLVLSISRPDSSSSINSSGPSTSSNISSRGFIKSSTSSIDLPSRLLSATSSATPSMVLGESTSSIGTSSSSIIYSSTFTATSSFTESSSSMLKPSSTATMFSGSLETSSIALVATSSSSITASSITTRYSTTTVTFSSNSIKRSSSSLIISSNSVKFESLFIKSSKSSIASRTISAAPSSVLVEYSTKSSVSLISDKFTASPVTKLPLASTKSSGRSSISLTTTTSILSNSSTSLITSLSGLVVSSNSAATETSSRKDNPSLVLSSISIQSSNLLSESVSSLTSTSSSVDSTTLTAPSRLSIPKESESSTLSISPSSVPISSLRGSINYSKSSIISSSIFVNSLNSHASTSSLAIGSSIRSFAASSSDIQPRVSVTSASRSIKSSSAVALSRASVVYSTSAVLSWESVVSSGSLQTSSQVARSSIILSGSLAKSSSGTISLADSSHKSSSSSPEPYSSSGGISNASVVSSTSSVIPSRLSIVSIKSLTSSIDPSSRLVESSSSLVIPSRSSVASLSRFIKSSSSVDSSSSRSTISRGSIVGASSEIVTSSTSSVTQPSRIVISSSLSIDFSTSLVTSSKSSSRSFKSAVSSTEQTSKLIQSSSTLILPSSSSAASLSRSIESSSSFVFSVSIQPSNSAVAPSNSSVVSSSSSITFSTSSSIISYTTGESSGIISTSSISLIESTWDSVSNSKSLAFPSSSTKSPWMTSSSVSKSYMPSRSSKAQTSSPVPEQSVTRERNFDSSFSAATSDSNRSDIDIQTPISYSMFNAISTQFTMYTSSFETTLSNGIVTTDSGIIIVTAYDDRKIYTSTSLFYTADDQSSTYSSIFTTTVPDGFITNIGVNSVNSGPLESSTSTLVFSTSIPHIVYASESTSVDYNKAESSDSRIITSADFSAEVSIVLPLARESESITPLSSITSSKRSKLLESNSHSTVTHIDLRVSFSSSNILSYPSIKYYNTSSSFSDDFVHYATSYTSELVGSFTIDSGDAIASTNSNGEFYTATSLFQDRSSGYINELVHSPTVLIASEIITSDSNQEPHTVTSSLTEETYLSSDSINTATPSSKGLGFTHIENIDPVHVISSSVSSAGFAMAPVWNASVGWELQVGRTLGSNFSLTLPNVFGFYSPNYGKSKRDLYGDIFLEVDGIMYAKCNPVHGSLFNSSSSLECTSLQDVNSQVSGILHLLIMFNVGGSSRDSDIYSAGNLSSGTQTISFITDDDRVISKEIYLSGGSESPEDPEDFVYSVRAMEWDNSNIYYVLAGKCSSTFGNGKISLTLREGRINCDSWEARITNNLNDWYFPKSYETSSTINLESCNENEIVVNYSNVPAGYRVFLDVIGQPDGYEVIAEYSDMHSCLGTLTSSTTTLAESSSTFLSSDQDGRDTILPVITSTRDSDSYLHASEFLTENLLFGVSSKASFKEYESDVSRSGNGPFISTDSEGKSHTATSIIDRLGTAYAISFSDTESDGTIITATTEVIISTDSMYVPHTTITVIDGPESPLASTLSSANISTGIINTLSNSDEIFYASSSILGGSLSSREFTSVTTDAPQKIASEISISSDKSKGRSSNATGLASKEVNTAYSTVISKNDNIEVTKSKSTENVGANLGDETNSLTTVDLKDPNLSIYNTTIKISDSIGVSCIQTSVVVIASDSERILTAISIIDLPHSTTNEPLSPSDPHQRNVNTSLDESVVSIIVSTVHSPPSSTAPRPNWSTPDVSYSYENEAGSFVIKNNKLLIPFTVVFVAVFLLNYI
ncbi:Hyphally regulated cell wall protein N-terminal-domain-containing protein [Scheffersomyces coipomensis]|uniref:Hyphally regulated cell wall protein N-terminal-domain-containing protein n=1 Tax=Scheffersomyces coipomensis TaxID=1788519 RepID=UPI00315D90CC